MYMVVGADGKEYGPATAEQLRQWLDEGRITTATAVRPADSSTWQPVGTLLGLGGQPRTEPVMPPTLAPPAGALGATVASRHDLTSFPVAIAILLHYMTFGIFTMVWLNLMHGKMPRIRAEDPSAGKAIGFCFIPFYNLYWIFFTYRRLCLRLDEQRGLYGLRPGNLKGLATAACILQVIPYISLFIGFTILMPVFIGMVQASVNQLVATSATTAPRTTLLTAQASSAGISGGVVAAIVCACMIPVIALLAAIAIPSFVKARSESRRACCMNNMRLIDHAKEQAALEKGYSQGATVSEGELSAYLKGGFSGLSCPAGGHYTINPLGRDPECSEHGTLSAAVERRR